MSGLRAGTIIGGYKVLTINDQAASSEINKLVQRDGSGNFAANVITANSFIGNVTTGLTAGLIVKTGTGGILETLAAGSAGQFLAHNGTWATPSNDVPVATSSVVGGMLIGFTNSEVNRAVVLSSNRGYVNLPRQIPAVTLNNASTDTPSFYAPTAGGTSGHLLIAVGATNAPTWRAGVKGDVGLGNVDNESKATMFTNPVFTGGVNAGSFHATDGMFVDGNEVWHEDNFNPGSYAPINSPIFQGQVAYSPTTLGTTGTIALDFAGASLRTQAALTGNITYTGSNYANGRSITIRVINGGTTRTLTFPSSWVFVGSKPTNIVANKTGILTISCFGTTEGSCVAAWAVQT